MTDSADERDDIAYKRLVWHSRRGMLELDLILEPFVRNAYIGLDATNRALYRDLLDCEDQQLFNWFLRKEAVDDKDLKKIVDIVLAYNTSRGQL